MAGELDARESAKVLATAVDVRPTENVHGDPELADKPEQPGDDLSLDESEAILRIATDIRPAENYHPRSRGET